MNNIMRSSRREHYKMATQLTYFVRYLGFGFDDFEISHLVLWNHVKYSVIIRLGYIPNIAVSVTEWMSEDSIFVA